MPLAGVDEAGCAPLAGPVVAAAVILETYRPNLLLIHLVEADTAQHQFGPHSPQAIVNGLGRNLTVEIAASPVEGDAPALVSPAVAADKGLTQAVSNAAVQSQPVLQALFADEAPAGADVAAKPVLEGEFEIDEVVQAAAAAPVEKSRRAEPSGQNPPVSHDKPVNPVTFDEAPLNTNSQPALAADVAVDHQPDRGAQSPGRDIADAAPQLRTA